MKSSSLLDKSLFAIAFVGILILVNIIALGVFFRVDLTRDGQYTLSEASRDAVQHLDDRLTIKAYFSSDLPPPYSANARYVKDLLDEYYTASDGNLSYEFLDPMTEETEEDKEKRKEIRRDIFGRAIREETDVERELRAVGIQPVEVRVNEGDSLEVKRVYMGISLRYGDEKEVLPVVTNTRSLEYDLTTLIRKVTRTEVPLIGLVTGREGLDLQEDLSNVVSLLEQQYEVQTLGLDQNAEIPEDVDALIVTGPGQPFEADEADAIDAFVRSGRSAAFLLDALEVDLRTTQYEQADHGLDGLLSSYGVAMKPGLLLDAQCAQISVTQQRGFMRIAQPVQYPFLPMVRQLDQDHPLTRGMSEVSFPFVSAIEVTSGEDSPIVTEALVTSSERSWTETEPLNLNPMQEWPASISFTGPHHIVVALSNIGASSGGEEGEEASNGGRALVVGGSSVIQNQFLSGTGQALVLNLVDWLLLDEAMMAIRARGLTVAPLDEVSDGARNTLKYGNILGAPALFVAIGLIRWRLRERRRSQVGVEV